MTESARKSNRIPVCGQRKGNIKSEKAPGKSPGALFILRIINCKTGNCMITYLGAAHTKVCLPHR